MTRRDLLVLLVAAGFAVSGACRRSAPSPLAGADAGRGKEAIARYGCAACHTIPGVEGATGVVGPSLEHVATRKVLGGGHIPNTPENMITWIQHPQQIDPKNSMPELGVSDPDARDIAAYLYTLK